VAGELVERTDKVKALEQEYTRLQRASSTKTEFITPAELNALRDVVSKRERMEADAEKRGWVFEYVENPDEDGWRLYKKGTQ